MLHNEAYKKSDKKSIPRLWKLREENLGTFLIVFSRTHINTNVHTRYTERQIHRSCASQKQRFQK